jgi:hypothetical protein
VWLFDSVNEQFKRINDIGVLMTKKHSIEHEINEFMQLWDCNHLIAFLRDIIPIFELYDLQDEEDWVEKEVGAENAKNVRMIRMVYLISKISEFHAGTLCRIKASHKNLWKRMEMSIEKGPIV